MTNDEKIWQEIQAACTVTEKAFTKKANLWLDKYSGKLPDWKYNLGLALVETVTATQVAQTPQANIQPLNAEGETMIDVFEPLLKHYISVLNMEECAREVIRWWGITGLGLGKVGYYTEENTAAIGESGEHKDSEDFTIEPYICAPDPRAWGVDPYACKADFNLSDARYCYEIIKDTLGRVKANTLYDYSIVSELTADEISTDYPAIKARENYQSVDQLPEDYSLKLLYEMHLRDPVSGRISISTYAKGSTKPLRVGKPLPKQLNKFAYVPLQLVRLPGSFYGKSLLEYADPIITMMSNIITRMHDNWDDRKEFLVAYLDALDSTPDEQTGRAKVISTLQNAPGGETTLIEARLSGAKALELIKTGLLDMQDIQFLNLLQEFFHWVTGITYMDLGRASSRTATEAGLIQKSSDLRTNARMSITEQWTAEMLKRLLAILRYNRDKIPAEDILGGEKAKKWFDYEERQSPREKVKMDTDITVSMSVPINQASMFRRNQMLELLRSIGTPEILTLLAQPTKDAPRGSTINIQAIAGKIGRDSGTFDPIIIPLEQPMQPPAPQQSAEGV